MATAAPEHVLDQGEVAEAARAAFEGRLRDFGRLFPVFANTGILERQAVRPMDWYRSQKSWPERTEAYLDGGVDLFVRAATRALELAGIEPQAVDTVVTVSSTGVATPSLEARAMARLPFRADIARVPLFGLGCAGGVTGLSLAARLARARPGETTLVVAVELCTLAFRLDEMTSANLVATALFGDGAAACVLSTAGHGRAAIEDGAEHTWPDSLAIMGWRVDAEGFGVIFDRSIPAFVLANVRAAMEGMAARMGLALADVDRFVCHPGGAKVLEALEAALGLPEGALDHERAVLARHGNMSAPTALFVLERVLAAGGGGRRLMLSALGPGFTASALSLAT
ncbi:MAG TPA: type III polyketide synthase [Caulobacteraceae bacterium]|nr:type III polyketide synthase [Caulobacteraceae bacterium]